MDVLSLIGSALGLTDTILNFIKDSRGYEIRKDIEKFMLEISEEETVEPSLRDDGKLDDLYSALDIKLRLFSSFLKSEGIQQKNV